MDEQLMRVAIDISKLHNLNRQRGIGFYTESLISELQNNKNIQLQVIEKTSDQKKCDIVHFPFFDLFRSTLPVFKYAPTVVTIHDVIPLLFPKNYPSGIRGKIALAKQKLALKNVKAIITDSKASKKDIIKYLNIPESKIFPIYLAPNEEFKQIADHTKFSEVKAKFKLPETFVIYVGSVNWNKNLVNIAQGCINAGVDLVCVGGGFETPKNINHPELKSYNEFREKFDNHQKVHILGFVNNEDLVKMINLSKALLQISKYEGFGLPILEGQACQTAVITSNISSMPEVAGDGAILVDPEDVQGIAEAISKIVSDQNFRQHLIDKGSENLARFSWQKTAQETIEVYRYANNS